ncbi:MAG: class I SAM-dependent methyltransferase [Anaerocolumna sp.]
MQLSRRLKAVADTVTIGNRVADVGCDHAYISIYLIENDIAPNVIAMDVNKGPLKRAAENVDSHGYRNRIQTRLSDGLHQLGPGEADTILIAGMGGALMIKIMEEGMGAVHKSRELILQPQSEIFLVRKYLHQIGYCIEKEQMVKEDGKYYFIIKAEAIKAETIVENEMYDREVFYQYGKLLLEQREPLMKEYLDREGRIRTEVMKELKANPTEKAKVRLEEVNQEIAYIEEASYYYK